ncbi:MAG: ParB/RepB/Spo0J family partition protein [Actinomycetota bacterium]|jgi:ParB family chromosome partitioning protein|nr:ParB/RepB/Spo0J family partition protein [Actinomycetota bacterium]
MAAGRKSGLGRGLEALLSTDRPTEGFALVPIDAVSPNPRQPRERFDQESLDALAASIREVGVLQPIVIGPADDEGRHVLVAGERRLRAAKVAGLYEIPAVIRRSDDAGRLAESLVENIQREDLGPLEEAAAYRSLLEDFAMTHEQVARRVGKSRSTITNAIRLLNLPGAIQGLLVEGKITAGAARALLGTDDVAFAVRVANRAADEGWSVRQVEDAVRGHDEAKAGGAEAGATRRERPAELIALEERLTERLGSPVRIQYGRRGGGRLTIRFGSVDDLERIYRELSGG